MDDFKSYKGKKTDFEAEATKFAAGYDGKSEGELMREIYARALEGKRNGTLTNEEIDAFAKQFAPMLDPVKRKKLFKVVESLKKM